MNPSGVLLVDKPVGPTSHDLVQATRRSTGIRRVGHAGTLDPFASGLLLILIGTATRLSEYFLGMPKEYRATVELGKETTTHDVEGEVARTNPAWRELRPQEVEAALDSLRGPILQRPPVYSAKKLQGEAAHRRVRRGEEVELEPVEVTIHRLELLEMALPKLEVEILCSSGTYIRAVARDLGRVLGVGGHLSSLRRTAIGPHSVASALTYADIGQPQAIWENLTSPAEALGHLPGFEVGPEEAARVRQGRFLPFPTETPPGDGPFRVLLHGDLVAVAGRKGDQLRPQKVFGAED